MKLTLFTSALVALMYPQTIEAVPIDANGNKGERWWRSTEADCTKWFKQAVAMANSSVEMTDWYAEVIAEDIEKGQNSKGRSVEVVEALHTQAVYLKKQAECASKLHGEPGKPGVLFTTKDQCKVAIDRIKRWAYEIDNDPKTPTDPPHEKWTAAHYDVACEPRNLSWLTSNP